MDSTPPFADACRFVRAFTRLWTVNRIGDSLFVSFFFFLSFYPPRPALTVLRLICVTGHFVISSPFPFNARQKPRLVSCRHVPTILFDRVVMTRDVGRCRLPKVEIGVVYFDTTCFCLYPNSQTGHPGLFRPGCCQRRPPTC